VRLEWISAAEGDKVKKVVNGMTEQLSKLGPLGLPGKEAEWDREMEGLEAAVKARQTMESGKEVAHA